MEHVRVLIVEDEILIAREIESHLHGMHHEVVGIAVKSDTVMQMIAKTQPDLVLMDINLQGEQDGIVLTREIRDRFQIPVIYITAYADPNTLERAKATNPFGYILKPFNETDLRVAVELALFRQKNNLDSATQISPPAGHSNAGIQEGGLPPSKLQKILIYINDHLGQALRLEQLANEVDVTTFYFARLFKQSTGKSVHQYVIHQRVERAKQLLQESDRAIADIATECGFANPSHLALHFKRIVGTSPKKYRHS